LINKKIKIEMSGLDNYKKVLEDFLQKIDFIYSGDVISSVDKSYFQKIKHSSFSPELIKEMMIDIYNFSFDQMIQKSKEVIIHRNNFLDIYELMNKISINPKIIFYSQNSNLNLNLGSHVVESEDVKSFLPSYFNRRFKLLSHNREVSAYYSPLIEDDLDDSHFYLVDKPIQSMVWSLQNMNYVINKGFSSNEHSIKIPIYNCDYEVYKIRVVNTQKLREDKINSILDGN
jgi:hypothetical protein